MPAKNSNKFYVKNSYYHIYNRGVEKRKIFKDEQDYGVFLSYLKEYLSPKDKKSLAERLADPATTYREKDKILKALRLNNFADKIALIAYCLMPNHFHFLLKQEEVQGIDAFMNSLATRYTLYFNRKYKRVGTLYQGVYKGVLVATDEQLLHLTRYIHRNPLILASQGLPLQILQTKPSSYPEYIGKRKTSWVHQEKILPFFSKTNRKLSYQSFVSQENETERIKEVTIDMDS